MGKPARRHYNIGFLARQSDGGIVQVVIC